LVSWRQSCPTTILLGRLARIVYGQRKNDDTVSIEG
jgi:hypothetical protein